MFDIGWKIFAHPINLEESLIGTFMGLFLFVASMFSFVMTVRPPLPTPGLKARRCVVVSLLVWCFSHGQLYVVPSKVERSDRLLRILCPWQSCAAVCTQLQAPLLFLAGHLCTKTVLCTVSAVV